MQEGKELICMQFVRAINGHACNSSLHKYLQHACTATYRGIKGVVHGGG